MRKLRNLTVLFLVALAAMWFSQVGIQAEPDTTECTWSYGAGGYNGTWSCPWGCDYHYFHEKGEWVQTGQEGDGCDLEVYE